MCNVLPDLVLHFLSFICSPLIMFFFFDKCSDFIQLLSTCDFSDLSFAELSTNLVYNSIFVIGYGHIYTLFVVFLFNQVFCIK